MTDFGLLVRAEWTKFRTVRGWVIGMLVAVLLIVLLGVFTGSGSQCSIANVTPQIVRIDTQNPGAFQLIDISAFGAALAVFGLGYDGHWAYAASFFGGAGLCFRFLATPAATAG